MTNEERLSWLKDRQSGLGSSDAPNLCGVGFRDAMSVYRSKVEPIDRGEAPTRGPMARGLALEDTVAAMYEEVMDAKVGIPIPAIFRHAKYDWITCTPDRRRLDDGRPVQLKAIAGFGDDWGPTGSDEIPEHYRIERLHEMAVMGVEQMDLIALDVIAWEPRVYRLFFDANAWASLLELEAAFWHKHVERREPPEDWEERYAEPFAREFVKGKGIELDAKVRETLDRRAKLKSVRDEADTLIDQINTELRTALGDAEVGVCGTWKVKRIPVKACSFTVERQAYERLDVRAIKQRVKA